MNSSPQYPPRPRRVESGEEPAPVEATTISMGDVDELLEEIDELLEDQAVLTNFRQRSGQ
ncbi:MAG: hypothetical protein ACRDZ7_21755 [Acidimicrobiia bacterium]